MMHLHLPNFKRKTGRKGKIPRHNEFSPSTHWSILVSIFLIFNILIVSYGVYTFYKMQSEDFFTGAAEVSSGAIKLNEKALKSTLDYFESKAQKESGIIAGPRIIVDPSL